MIILDILNEHLSKLEKEREQRLDKELEHEIYSVKQEIHKYMEKQYELRYHQETGPGGLRLHDAGAGAAAGSH